jgi:alpha-tubulin suppressor-like RCC1 family protein
VGVWAWGGNFAGELGDGTTIHRHTPVQVRNLSNIIAIGAGDANHSIALRNDGTVWAWGENSRGHLGDGTTMDRTAYKYETLTIL